MVVRQILQEFLVKVDFKFKETNLGFRLSLLLHLSFFFSLKILEYENLGVGAPKSHFPGVFLPAMKTLPRLPVTSACLATVTPIRSRTSLT